MAKNPKKILSRYELEFLARTFAAREAVGLTQGEIAAKLGGITQDHYKQYEVRSPLPHHLIDAFLTLTKVSYAYLFTGREEGPAAWRERYQVLADRQKAKNKVRKAA